MIWTAIAILGASVSVFMTVVTLASLRFAEKQIAKTDEDDRCHELRDSDRCELPLEHEGPHKVGVVWWRDTRSQWLEAQARADAQAKASRAMHAAAEIQSKEEREAQEDEIRAKLAWDLQNAAPGMYAK